jgi:ATP-dependent DNA helicase PIF1
VEYKFVCFSIVTMAICDSVMKVIVTGDFFQLPPVTKGSEQVKFAFEAELWNESIKHTFNLTKVFRQHDEGTDIHPLFERDINWQLIEFVGMLNEMRFGQMSPASISRFQSLSREIVYEDGLGPTELSVFQ